MTGAAWGSLWHGRAVTASLRGSFTGSADARANPQPSRISERNEIAWDLEEKIDDRAQIAQHLQSPVIAESWLRLSSLGPPE
jgi:hypothetical protein